MSFYNTNVCKSFNQSLSSTLVSLSAMVCSEVTVLNRTGQTVYLYDNNNFSSSNNLLLLNNDVFTVRGLTDCSSLSAQTLSGGGTLYYRTAYFSNYNQG